MPDEIRGPRLHDARLLRTATPLHQRLLAEAVRAHEHAVESLFRSRAMLASAIEVMSSDEPVWPPGHDGEGSLHEHLHVNPATIAFIGELLGRQNELASTEECDRQFMEELERSQEIEDRALLTQRLAAAYQRYRACMERRRPKFVVPEW